MEYEYELKHYGVLGMKWGIRRARKKGTTYKYESRTTKRLKKRADKYDRLAKENKDDAEWREIANHAKTKAKRSAEFDKKMETSVRKSGAGKTTAKILINGIFGAKTYEACKAAGYGKAGSEAAVLASAWLAGPVGNMAMTALARHDYVNKD